ncbi:MAG TPA: hypothetical protein VHZ55_35310 [Bryobacteraceae bacterium]|nr:hypothetical protein [Bryobacteraceae bacterium]
MTKMVVRLMGPGIKPGSQAALPKTIYRAADQYARIEDPPDAKQRVEKITIIRGREAYSIDLIDKRGTHTTTEGLSSAPGLPIVLPLDPRRKLGKLDGVEFGTEARFFEQAGAKKVPGPIINAKQTEEYRLPIPSGTAMLVVRHDSETPVTLSWKTSEGRYTYEYIQYETMPFEAKVFEKPAGIEWKEIPPDTDSTPNR